MATQRPACTEAVVRAQTNLEPAKQDDFRRELTSCLALCAASGMSADDRREWLRVAWATLNDVPSDLLELGASAARRQCDHPSKIVPTIMREIEQRMEWRKDDLRRAHANADAIARREKPTAVQYATPEQIEQIKAEVGLVTAPFAEKPKATGPARMPTRADYIALGVDPVVLAALPDQAA